MGHDSVFHAQFRVRVVVQVGLWLLFWGWGAARRRKLSALVSRSHVLGPFTRRLVMSQFRIEGTSPESRTLEEQ